MQTAANAHDATAHTPLAPVPTAPTAPKQQTGILDGLKSRVLAIGDAIAHPRRPNLASEVTAMSARRVATRGWPVLPHHQNEVTRQVLVPLPELSGTPEAESLAYKPANGAMSHPVRAMQSALGGLTIPLDGAAKAAVGGSENVDVPSAAAHERFTGGDPAKIKSLLDDVRHALRSTSTASDEVLAAQGELLIHALADATSGHPERARGVLHRLQQGLSFEPQAKAVQSVNDRRTPLAWKTAQQLAATATGYDCMRNLAGGTWPESGAARYAPRVWLQAAAHLAEATGCEADPPSIETQARSLDGDTSATTQANAASIVRAASRLWETQSADALTKADKGALLAGRQGFFADGPGTPFAATKSRIERFVNHTIPRATSDQPDLEPDDGEAALPVALQRAAYAAVVRPFGYQKSAVAAMRDGAPGSNLGPWDKDEKALNAAVRGAFIAMQEKLNAPASAGDGRPQHNGKLHKDSQAIHGVVSLTELEVLAEFSRAHDSTAGANTQRIEFDTELNNDTIDRIAARVAEKLDGDGAIAELAKRTASPSALPPSLRATRVGRLLRVFRSKLTVDGADEKALAARRKLVRKYLTNGSNVIDAAKIGAWRKHLGHDLPDKDMAHFDTIDRIALGEPIKPRGTTTQDYRDAAKRIIDTIDGSGKAGFSEGGQTGISTRGITAAAASLPLISPRLNLQAEHGNQSVLEFSRSSAAYKISFGTQQRNRFDAGGGLQIGHNFNVVRAAGNIEAGYQWDNTEQHTVDLSIARRLKSDEDSYDEKLGRAQLNQVNDYLFDNAGKGKTGRALWNDLGDRFFDNDDFSVAWNSQRGKVEHADVTFNARVGFKIGTGKISARANAVAGGRYQYVPRSELKTVDETGQTAVESSRFGGGHRAGVQLGLNTSISDQLKHAPTGTSTEPTDIATVTLLTPNVIGLELRLYDSFHQAKATLVREQGKLQIRSSNADTEFANFSEYKKALREDPAWMLTFGVKPGQPMPTTQEDYRKAMEVGSKKIEAYLSNLSANRVQNLRFVLRRRLREHAATAADALDDRIAALRARNGSQNAEAIDRLLKERDELLRRSDSWMPSELLTVQANDRQVATGLRLGLRIAAQKSARGEREVTSLKLKPRQADQMDRNWPRLQKS